MPTPNLEDDPEIFAAKKKNRLLELKSERFLIVMSIISKGMKLFRAEAVSLVSGVGTLWVGYYQIKKRVSISKREAKENTSEVVIKALPRRREASAPTATSKETKHLASKTHRRIDLDGGHYDVTLPPNFSMHEVQTEAPTAAEKDYFLDPGFYLGIIVIVIFVWSTVMAWKKRSQIKENFKSVIGKGEA